MQFSISAALVTMAICAGQTVARCSPGRLSGRGVTRMECQPGDYPDIWYCGSSSLLVQYMPATNHIFTDASPIPVGFRVSCASKPAINAAIHCDANSRGDMVLRCPRGDEVRLEAFQQG
ncbi:hypothetical protein E4U53_000874 [Claviceps sorghi]|nr:hypothetical protein E4U53_000874 [Claviceps sorghi]